MHIIKMNKGNGMILFIIPGFALIKIRKKKCYGKIKIILEYISRICVIVKNNYNKVNY